MEFSALPFPICKAARQSAPRTRGVRRQVVWRRNGRGEDWDERDEEEGRIGTTRAKGRMRFPARSKLQTLQLAGGWLIAKIRGGNWLRFFDQSFTRQS